MKPDDFDKDLRSVAGDFNLPVRSDLFADIMQARSKKRRRVLALYVCGLAALFFAVTAGIFLNINNPSLPLQAKSDLPEKTSVIQTQTRPEKSGNKQILHSALPEQYIAETNSLQRPDYPEKPEKYAQAFQSSQAHSLYTIKNEPVLSTQPAAGVPRPVTENIEPFDETTAGKTEPGLYEKGVIQSGVSDSALALTDSAQAGLAAVNDSFSSSLANQPSRQEEKHTRFIAAGIYANYFAITNAINASSLIPFNKQDSFGLNESANYAFSTGLKGSYQFHKNWSVCLGVGVYKLQFDRVRFEEARVDSSKWNELTNSGQKDARIYSQNITEHAFTWLELPVGIAYTTPLGKKLSFCTEIGMVYQTLLQNSVYEFTSSSAGDLTYTDKTNAGLERINKNTASWYVQPGVSAALSKRISMFAGLTYRRQFISYYQKDYFNTGSFYMMGGHVNLMYKF